MSTPDEMGPVPAVGAGREPAAAAIRTWLTDVLRPRLCVVTGAPGTGKSHLTAWIALTDAYAGTDRARAVHSMISARSMTVHSMAWALAEQLTVMGGSPGAVIARIAADRRRATIVIADLDEAGPGCDGSAARDIITGLLTPLLELQHIRLLVEGRPDTVNAFSVPADVVHLDVPELTDRQGFAAWLRTTAADQNLADPNVIETAGALFPNAGLAELALRARSAEDVVERWLDQVPHAAWPALEALAFAYAPLGHRDWHYWTTVLVGDTRRARESLTAAVALVTHRDDTFTIGLRPLREAILRRRTPETTRRIENALVNMLHGMVPKDSAGTPQWSQSPPYVSAHLLRHAASTGVAGRVLADPGLLVHADPRTVTAVLETVGEGGDFAVRVWSAWRPVGHGILAASASADRAALLRLSALVRHDRSLAELFSPHCASAGWTPAWIAVRPPAPGAGRWTGPVCALALGVGARSGQLMAAAVDGALHTLTGADGVPVGRLAGAPEIWGLVWFPDGTVLHLDAHGAFRSGTVTKAESRADRISSLLSLAPGSGDEESITANAVLTAQRIMEPTALGAADDLSHLVLGDSSGTVHAWKSQDGPSAASAHVLHDGPVTAVTCVRGSSGRPSVISGGADGAIRLWTLGEQPVAEPLIQRNTTVTAAAFATLADGPVAAVAWNDGEIRIWDLTSGDEAILALGLTVNALALAPDGLLAVAGAHGIVALQLHPSRLFAP